jgi:hypothetical protein
MCGYDHIAWICMLRVIDKNLAFSLQSVRIKVWYKTLIAGKPPNGLRYPLVGGTRQRHFDGINLKPHKLPENAQTPTSRVHALLGTALFWQSAKLL